MAEHTLPRSNEPQVVLHLIRALSATLENGIQTRRPTIPAPLPEGRIKAIQEAVPSPELRKLIAQLDMIAD